MDTIVETGSEGKLPVRAFETRLQSFVEPLRAFLPDERLRAIPALAIQGILAGQSPLITRMATGVSRTQTTSWPMAKRLYRFIWNERFTHRHLLKGLYALAQKQVAQAGCRFLLVALDPVNFEKPYTHALEGVSSVMKRTPPGPGGEKRITPGYPAITATVVNLPVPVITYANWFSYRTQDFVSENRELYRAMRTTRALFPAHGLCFLGDAGLDDQHLFQQMNLVKGKFILRAYHNRLVEVYQATCQTWETHLLKDYLTQLPTMATLRVKFQHAHGVRIAQIGLAWCALRLPETHQRLSAVLAYDPDYDRCLILLSNLGLAEAATVIAAYKAWRFRPRIEHTYRFDQEQGLDVEDLRVQTLERMRRVFILVLLAALFVYDLSHTWTPELVLWFRELGGKLGRKSDCDGPYLLLAGISMFLHTVVTLRFAQRAPLPAGLTCG
jgi:hypothetical protein